MFRILCYSYKGGTGRTTAAANIATILAGRGHKVLCIDMDIEGPGLSVLFEVESESGLFLQDYLSEPNKFDLENALIDVGKSRSEWGLDNDRLFLLPASIGFEKPVNYTGERPRELIRSLFEEIDSKVNPDLVLMDSPSGYGDMSALSMVFADFLLLLFRWCRQHLIGTARIAEFIKYLRIEFVPIASNVPQPISPQVDIYRKLLEKRLERQVAYLIPEDDELKWKERVLVFDKREALVVKSYSEIANRLEGILKERDLSK